MTRTKTARLSLTVSPSLELHDDDPTTDRAASGDRPETSPLPERSPVQVVQRAALTDGDAARLSGKAKHMSSEESLQSPTSSTSPTLTSLPPFPPSPGVASKQSRDTSKSFFANLKNSRGSSKPQTGESTIRKVPQDKSSQEDFGKVPSRTKSTPDLRSTSSSEPVPELPGLEGSQAGCKFARNPRPPDSLMADSAIPSTGFTGSQAQRRPAGHPTAPINIARSHATISPGPASPSPENQDTRKNGRLFHNFMRRNHSNRAEDAASLVKPPTPVQGKTSETQSAKPPSRDRSTGRNPSPHGEVDDNYLHDKAQPRMALKDQRSQSFRDGAGGALFNGLRHTKARAAEGIGKAHTRLFRQNKAHNTGANRATEYIQNYELKVINLPLIEQTRITRIARRLEESKDRTEFWMPALPWRCIDYLNLMGSDVEGLYRVPGSEREVRVWKQRFDQEHDVNLLEEEDLYDVNIIGSLFKAWLRELPDEIFPQSAQEQLSEEHGSEDKAPNALQDALSNLPPWNYYLLFAITCHLSILNACSDKNKMSYHNLFVCFAPALKMNGDCFRWLVTDWRRCWKPGICRHEKAALAREYQVLDDPDGLSEPFSHLTMDFGTPSSTSATLVTESARSEQPTETPDQARDPHRSQGRGTKEPRAARASSATSRDGQRQVAQPETSVDDLEEDGSSTARPKAPVHSRSASKLPELSFPQPISPIFTTHH